MAYKGKFKPRNPQKYLGDASNIIYRSRWELKLMMELDSREQIVEWASEEIAIRYIHPVDKKYHRYFPDFWVKSKKADGFEIMVIEVKPYKQTQIPTTKNKKRFIQEAITYEVNQSKWKAAKEVCADRNWKFIIMTEHELDIKF